LANFEVRSSNVELMNELTLVIIILS